MPDISMDTGLRLRVLNVQNQPLGGTVNLEFTPQGGGQTLRINNADASKDIDVSGLQRAPQKLYQITVIPSGSLKPASQLATVPATGFNTVDFVISNGTAPDPRPNIDGNATGQVPYILQGALIFDNGLPAAGITVRVYSIGFAGQDTKLGETKSDAQGKYSVSYSLAQGSSPNLQVRVLDSSAKEITISNTKFNASQSETLNLIVPSTVQPIAAEFDRLSADMQKAIGGIAKLAQAQEDTAHQDLTLLNQSTNWDARLLAFAATAAQQTTATGLGQDVLYAIYRVGLPSDSNLLAMVDPDTVQKALTKASQAGVVAFTDQQIAAATTAFRNFATKTRLAIKTPGIPYSFSDLLTPILPDANKQGAFTNLYLAQSRAADFWQQAAKLSDGQAIPAETLNSLKLEGKFLYLTFNNGPLTEKLRKDIGSLSDLSQMAYKDYYKSDAWKAAITTLAGSGGDAALDKLVPTFYPGAKPNDRLEPYAADLARKVRLSFPTHVVARMIDNNELAVSAASAANVSAFLKAAAPLGYELGRTPLNVFLRNYAKSLPQMAKADLDTLQTVHRLYQVTPSTESFQAALKLGFKSARDIASYPKDKFMAQYGQQFPPNEAQLVYGQSQTVTTVTFNVFGIAQSLDSTPPVYALSSSNGSRQDAKNAIVQQFPTMATLFGNVDFCECEECRSVLSPAAYFVDLLEFLRQSNSNAAGYTPLDVLIGQQKCAIATSPVGATEVGSTVKITTADPHGFSGGSWVVISGVTVAGYNGKFQIGSVPTATTFTYSCSATGLASSGGGSATVVPDKIGRRPDLGALPLSCENTNTALPYIDLVNEIFEYYIAKNGLDAGAAYDTGSSNSADLTAEPQHVLPKVYNDTLKQAVYPLSLPFDLWIETVRGFLNYLKTPLAQVLDMLRPADNLELFSDGNAYPYYRVQILAETLGLSPSEYSVVTTTDPSNQQSLVPKWFKLYGYPDNTDPNKVTADLKSAKTLANTLGISYQDLTDVISTGFINPDLYALRLQFGRFGIDITDAFRYTGQPGSGYPQFSAQEKTNFETFLDGISSQYTAQNTPTNFDAKAWLKATLPSNPTNPANSYSPKVLVLVDPDTGCNFASTTLQRADDSAATPLDFLKLNLFVRLWKKLGWSLDELDRALQLFFPPDLLNWSDPNFANAFSSAWETALVYMAHLDDLNAKLAPAMGRVALLPFWSSLTVQGTGSLYEQLFLTSSVLNGDPAFDDPNGQFPANYIVPAGPNSPAPAALSAHQQTIQGVLGLTADEINAILDDAASTAADAAHPVVTTGAVAGIPGTVPTFTLTNLSVCYRYSMLAKCLQMPVADLIALRTMSGLKPFQPLTDRPVSVLADDIMLNETLLFVKQVAAVQNSDFSVEDLKYLLRHQFDAVGKYRDDPNALMSLLQTIAGGLQQIQSQNNVDSNLINQPDAIIDPSKLMNLLDAAINQTLSRLLPLPILRSLLAKLTNSQSYSASQGGIAKIDPAPFADESDLALVYEDASETETVTYNGYLLDWKKAGLEKINGSAAFGQLLDTVQTHAQAALTQSINDVLGAWSSLLQDQSVTANLSTLGAYAPLVGNLLAMFTNAQTYQASAAGAQIDTNKLFSALASAKQNDTITDPVPDLTFSYDPASNTQTVACAGVLTDVMRGQLAALIAGPSLLSGLLQSLRDQAVSLFQAVAKDLLTSASSADLDKYVQPLLMLDISRQQKVVKAQLASVFLPVLARKLSRQLVAQTLASNLGADVSLTQILLTDSSLLSDPLNSGEPLIRAFLATGQPGVTASYFASTDGSGVSLSMGRATTTDTTDPTNANAATTHSAHFEGYLQVPSDGAYRFFVQFGDAGGGAAFRLDPPDPTLLTQNPVLSANNASGEVSQFVRLKGGAAYHFSLDLSSLGSHGARLLIQGETLPKGPLSQVLLYPQQTVTDFARAKTLLAKVLQILQVIGVNQREIKYLIANNMQFDGLNLDSLPTQASDDSAQNASTLFSHFITLTDYADLRKGPAGGSDGLIDVFQATASTSTQDPAAVLAQLTRRDPQVVRDIASAIGSNVSFKNNIGVRRIWDALQLVQTAGIPVSALAASTAIASLKPPASLPPDQMALNFKNAVKARYTPSAWRPIAQSIFDRLRQEKRDALVAYLINRLGLENSNQLFERFLVDPGMEPVAQTSRLRLALSSVQTFIQRCLLNLENAYSEQPERNVAPSAIDADRWQWMKRYRVWEANRQIFLFPENWMEPELRLDKSDLFQPLESALLQGDVNRELVEDAFLAYIKGLDERARLDIVSTYLDQPQELAESTLYVLGRTHGTPPKYFYRAYSDGTWSAWIPVTADIQGNHIALARWRDRLNIFWVTFLNQPVVNDSVSKESFQTLGNSTVGGSRPSTHIKVQLHWTEYFQGKWSPPIASDMDQYRSIDDFDDSNRPFNADLDAYIHVSKEIDNQGNEGAIRIHVDLSSVVFYVPWHTGYAFRVTSKNADPDFSPLYWHGGPPPPYVASPLSALSRQATAYTGSLTLQSIYENKIASDATTSYDWEDILDWVGDYALVLCDNPVVPPLTDPFPSSFDSSGPLVAPFFYKDTSPPPLDASVSDELTFFVQPDLTEATIQQWTGWGISPQPPSTGFGGSGGIDQIQVGAQVPSTGLPSTQERDFSYSVYSTQASSDWLTKPSIAVNHGNSWIGPAGRINVNLDGAGGLATRPGSGAIFSLPGPAERSNTGGLVLVGKQGVRSTDLQLALSKSAGR